MQITQEHEVMLARLSETSQSPEAYEAMLKALPDSVKRTFVELDTGVIREYSVRNVKKRLADNPEMAKLLDAVAVRQIVEQVYNNIIEDQKKVRTMMGGGEQRTEGGYRTIRR